MIITIESWHQLMELHHQKSIVEAKINHILNCINWLKSNEATEKSKEQISELKSERDDYLYKNLEKFISKFLEMLKNKNANLPG